MGWFSVKGGISPAAFPRAALRGAVTRTRRRPPRLTLGRSPRLSLRQSVERETPNARIASSIVNRFVLIILTVSPRSHCLTCLTQGPSAPTFFGNCRCAIASVPESEEQWLNHRELLHLVVFAAPRFKLNQRPGVRFQGQFSPADIARSRCVLSVQSLFVSRSLLDSPLGSLFHRKMAELVERSTAVLLIDPYERRVFAFTQATTRVTGCDVRTMM